MAGWRGVKSLKKSAIPGVVITQFVEDIPKGYSMPDFERKPITVTLQEGKNAIFRAVVKGEPKPKVLWKCNNKEMDDSQKYHISFNPGTNEFILQINKITSDDADLYRCIAVNEYGKATCTAGLKIIEVGFKKKTEQLPVAQQADLKKEIQDFRKTLKKRAPSAVPKKKMDMEQIGQLLLTAEKKDYEKICLKYGVVDFRGMLRKLQEMKREREDKQDEYVYSIANLKHVKVNKEQRNASFGLELELKNLESKICFYKDGQKINFGFNDDNLKYCLQQEGKNYHFTINDLQPEDAGIYQIKVEDVVVFSTELEAESIKNTQSSDKGTYTTDTGSWSSSTWLEVESSKGKRKQSEEDSSDKAGQWSKPLDEEHAKKLHQGERQKDQDLLADFSMGKDAQYGNGQDSNAELYSCLEKDGSLGSDGKIGFYQNAVLDGNIRGIGSLTGKASQCGKNAILAFSIGSEDTYGWQTSEGQVSTLNGADPGDRFNRRSVLRFQDSILSSAEVNSNQYIVGGNDGPRVGFGIAGKIEGLYGKKCVLCNSDQSGARFDSTGSLCIKDGGLSGASMLYFEDNMLSEVGERGRLYRDGCIIAEFDVTEGDIGIAGKIYDKDNHLEEAGAKRLRPQFDGTKSSCGNNDTASQVGDSGTMSGIYVQDVMIGESEVVTSRFPSAGGIVVYCGSKGMSAGSGSDRNNDAKRIRVLHSGDGMIVDASAWGMSCKKDILRGAVKPDGVASIDGSYNIDVVPLGISACNLGGSNNINGLYSKNDLLGGTGVGGQDSTGSISGSTLGGAVARGPDTIRDISEHHGKEVEVNGVDAGSIDGLYEKDSEPEETNVYELGDSRETGRLSGENDIKDGDCITRSDDARGIGELNNKNTALGKLCGSDGAGDIATVSGQDSALNRVSTDGPGNGGIPELYRKDYALGEPDGTRGIGGLYGKDGYPDGVSCHGPAIIGKLGLNIKDGKLERGKDSMPGETDTSIAGSAGRIGTLYDKGALLDEIGANEYGSAVNIAGPSDKDGIPSSRANRSGGTEATGGLHIKDCVPSKAGTCGIGSSSGHDMLYDKSFSDARDTGRFYGKDDIPDEASTAGLSGQDIMPCGFYAGGGSVREVGGLYVKGDMLGAVDASGSGIFDKDRMIIGNTDDELGDGERLASRANGIGETAGIYGKDRMSNGFVSLGGVSGIYDKDDMLTGFDANGPIGAGSTAPFYVKNSMPGDTSTVGLVPVEEESGFRMDGALDGAYAGSKLNGKGDMPAVTGRKELGARGMGESYDKDGIPNRTCATGCHNSTVCGLYDNSGTESTGMLGGKDGISLGAGTNNSGGNGKIDGNYGKDKMPNIIDVYGLCGVRGVCGHSILCRAGPTGYVVIDRIYGQDSILHGAGAGGADNIGGVGGFLCMAGGEDAGLCERNDISNREVLGKLDGAGDASGLYGKNDYLIGNDVAGGLDGLYGKNGVLGGRSMSGIRGISGLYGKDGALPSTIASEIEFNDEGKFNYHYNEDGALCEDGTGVRGTNGSLHEKKSDIPGEEFLGYGQSSGLYDAVSHAGDRRRQLSDLEASGSTPADLSRKGRGERLLEEDTREPLCHLNQGLSDVHAQKGKPTELSCSLNNDQLKGTWFKDGVKVTGLSGVSTEKNGLVHKLIIDKAEDSHAGKYKFEAEGICTEASIFVEDPPNVDSTLLEKLKKEPIVVKAGKNAMVKIPFEGRKPIKVTWLKDDHELLDDDRINIDSSDNFTRLSVSSTNRKDTGDYKVKLKNECGSFEAPLKLEVIDKPQSPTGPIEVVDSSTNGITIQWKPPRDDGGKPIQSYIIERQQIGRKTWVTLGKTSGSCTIFTTNKVEHDTSYYFRVKAVNSLGTSEALESDEVMAAAKASPSPPAPPKIINANKDAITISWSAPHKIGNSRILGYTVEKRKKGSNIWTSVTALPITDRKYTVNDLKEGLQYEFRVAAINNAGVGEASAPSEPVYARDPIKPPGPVKNLKVVNADYCSISLSWMKPESAEESYVKGYIVEIQHSDTLKWTQCNALPIQTTTYTVRGLKARETYFLRVRAISDGGLGDPVEIDTCVQAAPPPGGQEAGEQNDLIQCNEDEDRKVSSNGGPVYPKFLVKDTVESFMNVKAGDAIHVRVPFEASPSSEVIWLKDGLSLPTKATTATRERLSQLIIPRAELSDSGHYGISLQTEHGKKETFSFLVQVLDIPESPGPIQLIEKVPGTVTLIWEPSPTEKRESNLTYVVMRRDSSEGSWQMVADHIYTNKYTVVNFIPGREYFFRVLAKNCVGVSKPSETVKPWTIQKEKDKSEFQLPKYRGINRGQPPRFLVQLKPHVVNLGFDCHMSCAVTGYPAPQVTWYKGNKNLSQDPAFICKNDFGVCSLMIQGVTPSDGGQYKVLAINELGQAISKAELTVKGKD
ncbi:immunoglobulin-like and fibronectin type III domain-containing protein 1 isoform X2 [Python bivittatus]|uniref:immunoglobulin-like and fibronectin type III domain-containing protein 1 isoform X2 n=1 Tax=Python bivittatus TaxID=176946 RepID=UPI000D6A1692|nr:immunoglobulin-like and fibronectin type III domain-containing protein 1 isoform X2 [Python bivittatus]